MKKVVSILIITVMLLTVFAMPAGATSIEYKFGDVNMDRSLSVLDSTEIMLHCAKNVELEHISKALADFDNDSYITVMDATSIQMYLAKLIQHPRDNSYLEFYVEIEDIYFGKNVVPLTGRSVEFYTILDGVYNATGDKDVRYSYSFKGITDESYSETYEAVYSSYAPMKFDNPGIYEVTVTVYQMYNVGTYNFTKQFEVLPAIEFDGLRFVDYDLQKDSAKPTEDVKEVQHELVFNDRSEFSTDEYGYTYTSSRFVALIHTKDEYDRLFGINNQKFSDEFFEDKSLAIAVTLGNEWYDYSEIHQLLVKDDVLYIGVIDGNNNPYEGIEHPAGPTWYSFAAVDKADVEHITAVQRF